MIIPDANLLIYAYDEESPFHAKAKAWLEKLLRGEEAIGLLPVVIFAFVRISTHARAFEHPLTISEAASAVASWMECPPVRLLEMTLSSCLSALTLLGNAGTGGNLTTDAQIAAVAMEHSALVHTADGDFTRFGVKWKNPIR